MLGMQNVLHSVGTGHREDEVSLTCNDQEEEALYDRKPFARGSTTAQREAFPSLSHQVMETYG